LVSKNSANQKPVTEILFSDWLRRKKIPTNQKIEFLCLASDWTSLKKPKLADYLM
jgi:hypothetical protein